MPMPSPLTVLVVDDHEDSRDMIGTYLSSLGWTVATAATGVEAIAVAETLRPQVVLMDLALPGIMDGWETTRRVKSHPLLKQTVVIAVTAHGFAAAQEKAMHAGCAAVFVKPCNLEALSQRIEHLTAPRRSA